MNDFEQGIKYTFEYIKKHLIGNVVNGELHGIITQKMLEDLEKTIPKKCDFCPKPCGQSWCSTKK